MENTKETTVPAGEDSKQVSKPEPLCSYVIQNGQMAEAEPNGSLKQHAHKERKGL